MNTKYLNVRLYVWLLFILVSVIFVLFPQIDLYTSNLFYNGKDFYLNGSKFEELFYYSVKPTVIASIVVPLFIFIYNLIGKKNILQINAKVMLYIILVVGIGPGLIVNVILKDNWGRPRPHQIVQFGGKMKFSPAFIPTKQEGYSFSCGHGAAAFSLIGFALLATKRRKFWMSLALSYGILVSVARIIAGGHFLSDTITSFFIVWISTHIVYKFIFKKDSF